MFTVSELFKEYISQPNREFELKAEAGTTTYTNNEVVEFEIEDSVVPGEEFTIGTVISSRLNISISTTDTIPENAKIIPYVRLNGSSGYTEWVPLGSYYIDDRLQQNKIWKFTCYDKLITTEQLFVSALTYPASMLDVIGEIFAQLDVTAHTSLAINEEYVIPYKDEDITIRNMLSYIASAHSSSVRMTKDGKINFVQFASGAGKTLISNANYATAKQTNPVKTYTRIVCTYNSDGETYEAGTGDDDHTLNIYNPFMTQAILDNVLATFNGFSYTPCTMEWKGFVYLEPGDAIDITQPYGIAWNEADIAWNAADFRWDGYSTFPSIILTNKMSFKGGLKATSTAPSVSAQKSEFKYKGSLTTKVEKIDKTAVKQDVPYYGTTISKAKGINVTRSDNASEVILNSDELIFKANGVAKIYFDIETGEYVIDGNITMRGGSISWDDVTKPTYNAGEVGARPYDWNPNYSDIIDAKPQTYIDAFGIYTGTLTAEQINAISGITLGTNATINWATVGGIPTDIVYDDGLAAILAGYTSDSDLATALAGYVTSGTLSTELAAYLTTSNFNTLIGEDYIVTGLIAANRIAAGTLTSFTIKTAEDGTDRVVLNSDGYATYNSSNQLNGISMDVLGSTSALRLYKDGSQKFSVFFGQVEGDAVDKLRLSTNSGVPMKLISGGDMSIETTGGDIYIGTDASGDVIIPNIKTSPSGSLYATQEYVQNNIVIKFG